MKETVIENISGIRQSAAEFITHMNGSKIFAFEGNMGAGKTTFIKALCEELGVEDAVSSPTFSIVNEYRSSASGELIYHFDFYRINTAGEALEIGVDDYLCSGALCLIEWPEKIRELLPSGTVFASISEQPDGSRRVTW
ncbi:MAG: tRNA (adenosine(37)-N6)-threonylcarbamoyltransferase complex ATPase subunit type 1 TsaE [Tannerella sp.]|jgi:tRNA threonylcarbamoyladenosine biosynthesis protein TsaE|nr:tRNA (adenosine(37)-N6)-threonylcarbamoyltransferase complex ATPase subunit type 1 TsaE [Tannerella sp.]